MTFQSVRMCVCECVYVNVAIVTNMTLRRKFYRWCLQFEAMKDREIRIALYSTFLGAILGVIISYSLLNHHNQRETKPCISRKPEENKRTCPVCPKKTCPSVSGGKLQLSADIMDFIDNHMDAQRHSPLLLAWTRLTS